MSYSFRSRPKLSDRYRGKSGDEILNELKNQIDEERKMFFESSPGWESVQSPGSFSRAGHPIDDMMSRGRQDIRSHLDDLAQRHPEFAEHLRCPPWGGEMGAASHGTWDRKRRGSGSSGDDFSAQETMPEGSQPSEECSPSRGRPRQNNLPQYGLRNTVDLGQQQQQQQQQNEDQEKGRGQRSWSAPPDNRTLNPPDPPRFVSRLDIPINATPHNTNPDQGKPPVAPKQPQSQNVQNQQSHPNTNSKQSQQGSTVRHIPIFVEGRDEPLLPKAAETPTEKIFTERVQSQPTFNYGRPSQFTARQNHQQPQTPIPPQTPFSQNSATSKSKSFVPQPAPSPQQTSPFQQKQSSGQQQDQSQQKPTQPTKQSILSDAISRVQAVQKEVDELKLEVDNYSGNSRKDKEYLFLDEMLTRCLVSLDNIETEGKDDVRQARKAVIRNIQQCISILESKVPSSEEICQNSEEMGQPVEVCENTSDPAGQDSVKLEEKPETIIESVRNNGEKLSQSEQQTMEVENLLPPEEVKVEIQTNVKDSHSELAMEAEPIGLNKGVSDEVKSEPSIKNVISEQTSNTSVTNVSQVAAKQLNSDSVKSNDNENKDGDLMLQKTQIQVDKNIIKDNSSQEKMEVDNACITDTKPDSFEKDEKTASISPKDGTVVSNKTCKSKSPKGSPKKGKRA